MKKLLIWVTATIAVVVSAYFCVDKIVCNNAVKYYPRQMPITHPHRTSSPPIQTPVSQNDIPVLDKPSRNSEPDTYFTSGLWPEEGRPKFVAQTDIPVLEKPSRNSKPVEGFIIKKGNELKFLETQYQAFKIVEYVLPKDLNVEARNYGDIKYLSVDDYYGSGENVRLVLAAGEKIGILQYRAEGTFFYKYHGEVYAGHIGDVDLGFDIDCEWWVSVSSGIKQGWVLISTENVTDNRWF